MKIYTNFILTVIFILTNAFPACSQQDKSNSEAVLKAIHERKSVRHFTGESVTKEDLEKILRAGMSAPTAVNKQPWSFVVVTDRTTLDSLADKLPSAKMLFQAGAAIIFAQYRKKRTAKVLNSL
jgi:nitroreductase